MCSRAPADGAWARELPNYRGCLRVLNLSPFSWRLTNIQLSPKFNLILFTTNQLTFAKNCQKKVWSLRKENTWKAKLLLLLCVCKYSTLFSLHFSGLSLVVVCHNVSTEQLLSQNRQCGRNEMNSVHFRSYFIILFTPKLRIQYGVLW